MNTMSRFAKAFGHKLGKSESCQVCAAAHWRYGSLRRHTTLRWSEQTDGQEDL
jgi:hypothetical protein